jgi:hypothetical protein
MSFEDYQALDGLNASKLKPYLSSSKDGLYSEEKIWAASRALSMGNYIHARVLEGKTALDNFVTDGFPINVKTGKAYGPTSQKYLDWIATLDGKKVLTPEDAEIATATSRAVLQHDGAQELLNQCPQRETAITWICEFTGVQCKAMIDYHGEHISGDLKSIGEELTTQAMQKSINRYNYALQFAFYEDGLRQNGIDTEFSVIFASTKAPHNVAAKMIQHYTEAQEARESESVTRLQGPFPGIGIIGLPGYRLRQFTSIDDLNINFGENNAL